MNAASPPDADTPEITGRCYCGGVALRMRNMPRTVAYCHCSDCRRWTGAPVAAFAAFAAGDLEADPPLGPARFEKPGIGRWFCERCGSPLAAIFDYLPGQVYVPLGLLDQAAELSPRLHCHSDARLPWLHIADDLDRAAGSGRDVLARG